MPILELALSPMYLNDLVKLALKFQLFFKNVFVVIYMWLAPISYVVVLTTLVSALHVSSLSVHLSDCQSEKFSERFQLEVWRCYFSVNL